MLNDRVDVLSKKSSIVNTGHLFSIYIYIIYNYNNWNEL